MRVSHRFRLDSPPALETRRLLSHVVNLPAAEVAVDQALAAGTSVTIRYTTRYGDGDVKVDDRTSTPGLPGSITFTHAITETTAAGTTNETEVDAQVTAGGVVTNRITTTRPGDLTDVEVKVSVIKGLTSSFNATFHLSNGDTTTAEGTTVTRGATRTTTSTETESNGVVEHMHTVTTSEGAFGSTTTNTTHFAEGDVVVSRSTTTGVRLA